MKKFCKILRSVSGTALTAALISTSLSGCSGLFVSTDAPELVNPSFPESSAYSYNIFSSVTPDISDISSVSSSENSGSENSDPVTSLPSGSEEYSRHPKLLEIEQHFSYNSAGRICLSDAQQKFSDKSLFVGDSICRGFSAYTVTKSQSVFAVGDVAARNFFDKDFYYNGEKTSYKDLLSKIQPEYIFLWMGMNDVNMTSAAEYCKNYEKIISLTLSNSNAKICVCAISPVNSNFTDNSLIDSFNLAIKQYIPENFSGRVSYIDFAYLFKNSSNKLADGLDSGDGIHLAPECYYAAIAEICGQLNITE